MKLNPLTPEEKHVIEDKGTERPFTGEYDDFFVDGTFICRRCNAPLFSSKSKFEAGCGWPAFDAEFPESVDRLPGRVPEEQEIECTSCKAHLGHMYIGEGFTKTNTRHCVNSLSIRFVSKEDLLPPVLTQT